MADVKVKGWVLRDTPTGGAVVFRWEHWDHVMDTVFLPKKLIAVSHEDPYIDEVTMPEWLAQDRGLLSPGLRKDHG
jgi:hypothetical protein